MGKNHESNPGNNPGIDPKSMDIASAIMDEAARNGGTAKIEVTPSIDADTINFTNDRGEVTVITVHKP